MDPIQRIVVPVDFSDHSARAVDMAAGMAQKLGAAIELIHVIEMPAISMAPYDIGIPSTFFAELRESAQQKLAAIEKQLEGDGLKVASRVGEPPAAVAIEELVKEVDADLVIMGTRGNTGIKHILLGSVAERVLRHVPCPVLAVK